MSAGQTDSSSTKREEFCKHKTGDYFHGMWICGNCYTALSGRPTKYGMSIRGRTAEKGETRQVIIWQAPIAKDPKGTTLGKFLTWMIQYLRRRSLWLLTKEEARQLCLDALREQGEYFGSNDACWTQADANEIVREAICAYWDEGPAGQNR